MKALERLCSNFHLFTIKLTLDTSPYLQLEKSKTWDAMETTNNMNVLNLECKMLEELQGVSTNKLPAVTTVDHELDND